MIFDANRIQIEGDTNLVLAEDVLKRFQAYGWYTDEFSFIQPDGSYKEDIEGLADVIAKAEKAAPDQPNFIKVHSLIASPTRARPTTRPPPVPSWVPRLLPASRKPSATIRKRTSTLTKRLWLTLARLPSAVWKPSDRTVRRLAQGQPGQGCPVRPSEGR